MRSSNAGTSCYGYAVYKITPSIDNTDIDNYFFLNFRDDRYSCYHTLFPNGYYGHELDLWVEYDGELNKFYYYSQIGYDPVPISKGELLNIWDIKQVSIPTTSKFEDFWPFNALIVTGNSNNKPLLIWGSHPSFSATHYKVYRALSNYPTNPQSLTYSLYTTVSSSTFSIADPDINLDPTPDKYAYYYIKAFNSNSNTFSSASNTVSASGDYMPQKKGSSGNTQLTLDNKLFQNSPNPFNPTTKINFFLHESDFVSIKVYDVLGKEIASLINEEMQPGWQSIDFTANNLSSGIYLYIFKTSKYTSANKMLLLK